MVLAIGNVDIYETWRAEHDAIARSLATIGVRAGIGSTLIGLDFDDTSGQDRITQPAIEHLADQIGGDHLGRPLVEVTREPHQARASAGAASSMSLRIWTI